MAKVGTAGRSVIGCSPYADVPHPGIARLHNPPVLKAVLGFERRVDKWDRLDPDLKVLAQVAAAAAIGCSWCLDFGYFAAHALFVDEGTPRRRLVGLLPAGAALGAWAVYYRLQGFGAHGYELAVEAVARLLADDG